MEIARVPAVFGTSIIQTVKRSNCKAYKSIGMKNIEMSVTVGAPQDRKVRSQITWLKYQIKYCRRKNSELFSTLENELMIDINIKFSSKPVRIPLSELEYAYEKLGSKKIKSFSILQIKYLGRKFESRKIFVKILEKMLINYYQGIVQYLKKWEKPVPQIPVKQIEPKTITPPTHRDRN